MGKLNCRKLVNDASPISPVRLHSSEFVIIVYTAENEVTHIFLQI